MLRYETAVEHCRFSAGHGKSAPVSRFPFHASGGKAGSCKTWGYRRTKPPRRPKLDLVTDMADTAVLTARFGDRRCRLLALNGSATGVLRLPLMGA